MGEGENKTGAGEEGVYRLRIGEEGESTGRNCTDSLLIGEEGQSVGEELGGRGVWG